MPVTKDCVPEIHVALLRGLVGTGANGSALHRLVRYVERLGGAYGQLRMALQVAGARDQPVTGATLM